MKTEKAIVPQHKPFEGAQIVLCASLLAATLANTGCAPKEAAPPPPPPAVVVENPEQKEVDLYMSFPSTLKGVSEVEIRARVSGYLEEANFKEGSMIKKGDHLFTIEQEPYILAVQAAEADLERAEAARQLAEKKLERLELALKSNSVSEVEVDIAAAELAQSIASVSQAKANLNNSKLDLSYTTVNAPITGRVSLANVSDENLVGYSEPTVITTIVDDSVIEAYFEVPERDVIHYLRQRGNKKVGEHVQNLPVKLQLADRSEYSIEGEIDFLDNRVDSMTRTIRLRAIFDNPNHELTSGMYASVQIPISPDPMRPEIKEAIVVPAESVLRDIGGRYVWVVDSKNIVERRGVDVGDTIVVEDEGAKGEMVRKTVILQGLDVSDRVIVSGVQRARDGAPVTPKQD